MSDPKPCPFCGLRFESRDNGAWRHPITDYRIPYCLGSQIVLWSETDKKRFNLRPGEREAYLAGWRAGREAAASIVEREASDGLEYCAGQTMALAVDIRAIPEPCDEPSQEERK